MKDAIEDFARKAENRSANADRERAKLSTDIATLTAIVTNGLSHKVDAMDKRMWAVVGFSLVTLIGIIVEILLRGRS